MDVGHLVTRPVVTCRVTTPIDQVAEIMRQRNVGSVVVTDIHGRLAGIITDRDIILRAVSQDLPQDMPVDRIMTKDVRYVYSTDDAFDAATTMATLGCRRMPVLDGQEHVTGLMALDDLLLLFARQMDKLARTVGHEVGTEPVLRRS